MRRPRLLHVFASTLVLSFVAADSLYDSSDPILELDTDTFNGAVYGTKKAHFVEFYSSWCGACIGYAPTFKKFAKHLSSWSPIVQVTTVNCADDKNQPICREHGISAFPTLKYYPYMSTDKDSALPYKGDKYDVNQMELDIAGLVQADWDKQKPQEWPSFLPIDTSSSLSDVWTSAGNVQFVGLAIEENPATMAWANIISFHNSQHVRVALARPQHSEVTKLLGSSANGRFLLFSKGNPSPVWTSPEGSKWEEIQEKLNEMVGKGDTNGVAPAPQKVEPVLQTEPKGLSAPDMSQYQLQLVDLQSALSYMLYSEIPRREIITGEELAGLKQWFHTLKKYAPGTTPQRRLLYRIDEWLQLKMDSVAAKEWTDKVDELQQTLGNPVPKQIEWIACKGSKDNLRGYTCGLWTLAHAISVEAYKQEKHNTNFRPVVEVLEPFRQFITRFLSCSECAQNFQKETEKHQMHLVTRTEDLVSWLWRVHNFVNTRLSGAPAEDPQFPKRQFPPMQLCAQCYDQDGKFDEPKTFEFLLKYYSDIKQDTVKPPPAYKVSEFKDGKLNAAGNRHLNPKFAVHADKVEKLEAAGRLNVDGKPQRQWRDIDGYDSYVTRDSSRGHFYLLLLSVIGLAIIFVYCKYKRNRSKFWKTFYYNNDFKMCPWSSDNQLEKKYIA